GDPHLAAERIEHPARQRECRRATLAVHHVRHVVIGFEADETVLAAAVDLPTTAQSQTGVEFLAALQRTTAQGIVGRPDPAAAAEHLHLFNARSAGAVPRQAVERATGDDTGAIDEAAPGGEVLADPGELVVESP